MPKRTTVLLVAGLLSCSFLFVSSFLPDKSSNNVKNNPILRSISENREQCSRPFSCLGCHRVEHRLSNLQEYLEKLSSAMIYCEDLAFVESKMLSGLSLANLTAFARPLKLLRREISRLSGEYGLQLFPPTLYFNSSFLI